MRGRAPLLVLLIVTGLVQLLAMPSQWVAGDSVTARAEAIDLLSRGRLGFDDADRPALGLAAELATGQYFVENAATHTLYSKYGFGYTLIYLPPIAIDRVLFGPQELSEGRTSLLVIVNLYNVLFALGVVLLLYRLAGYFVDAGWVRAGFTAAAIYGSFTAYYLRAPGFEIYQLAGFLGFCAALCAYLRGSPRALTAASACAGMLVLMRPLFGTLVVVELAVVVVTGGWRERRKLAIGVAPLAAALAIVAIVNTIKLGTPFATTYSQWHTAGMQADRFTASAFVPSLHAFLLAPGNANVFLHQPMLVLGILGWPALLRAHRREGAVVLACALACALPVTLFSNWHGEWCYGPRYLVHPLLVLGLPAVQIAHRLGAERLLIRALAGATVAGMLVLSFVLQVEMASVEYFTYYRVKGWFDRVGAGAVTYFDEPRLRGVFTRDLKQFVRDGAAFEPVEQLIANVPADQRDAARATVRETLGHFVKSNWLIDRR